MPWTRCTGALALRQPGSQWLVWGQQSSWVRMTDYEMFTTVSWHDNITADQKLIMVIKFRGFSISTQAGGPRLNCDFWFKKMWWMKCIKKKAKILDVMDLELNFREVKMALERWQNHLHFFIGTFITKIFWLRNLCCIICLCDH